MFLSDVVFILHRFFEKQVPGQPLEQPIRGTDHHYSPGDIVKNPYSQSCLRKNILTNTKCS